jgi:hypothetical protein
MTVVQSPSFSDFPEVPDVSGQPASAYGTLAWYSPVMQATLKHSAGGDASTAEAAAASPAAVVPCGSPLFPQGDFRKGDAQEGGATTETPWDGNGCVQRAFRSAREGLQKFAQSRQMSLREMGCTLLGLLVNTQTGEILAGQIGDGLVLALHPGIGARPLMEIAAPGDTGETYTLTQSDWDKYLRVRYLSANEATGISTLYVMSDGVAEDCIHPPPPDILQRWARDIDREVRQENPLPRTAVRLARWLAHYEAPGSFDDRTLVVLMR